MRTLRDIAVTDPSEAVCTALSVLGVDVHGIATPACDDEATVAAAVTPPPYDVDEWLCQTEAAVLEMTGVLARLMPSQPRHDPSWLAHVLKRTALPIYLPLMPGSDGLTFSYSKWDSNSRAIT